MNGIVWHIYIMSNRAHTLYVGSTTDLLRRYRERKEHRVPGFTARYTFNRLVYYELQASEKAAKRRERQIKAWSRGKKIALIESMNPQWRNLSWRIVKAAVDAQT